MDRFKQDQPTVPFTAAAQLDGIAGQEVVAVIDNTAASYSAYRVVTDHGGRLMMLPPPPRHDWLVGGSIGTGGDTYGCTGRRLIAVDAAPVRDRRTYQVLGYRIVRAVYVWTGGRWDQTSRTVRRGDGPSGSWVCPGLANWPGAA